MKILALLSLAMAAATKPLAHQLESYSFEKYVQDFQLRYPAAELESRRSLFNAELARVRAHNAKNLSWKEGINKYSAMTVDEKSPFHGRLKRVKYASLSAMHPLPADFAVKPVKDLPVSVDWRDVGAATAVKDQGDCGSCWAFASTSTIESHVFLSTGLLFDLSVEQMAMCAPNPDHCGGSGGCHGSTAELAFEYVSGSSGLYSEYQYPYESYYRKEFDCKSIETTSPVATIDGYVKLPDNNYTTLMNAVANVGPVAINVASDAWVAYESGVFDGCNKVHPNVNHVVVAMGYGEENGHKYWLVRNSYTAAFGEQGYIKLLRSDDDDSNCGLDIVPQNGVACEGEDAPLRVCGTCGAIYDASYPLNARLV